MNLLICLMLLSSPELDRAIRQAQASGRVLLLGESATERPSIPPGLPPVLAFRYFEGSKRHGFGGLDLVIDDAGH